MSRRNEADLAFLEASIDLSQAQETVMLMRLYSRGQEFFKNPANLRAFEKWKAERE